MKLTNKNNIVKEIFNTMKNYGVTEIPYYACHYIGDGMVRCIDFEKGILETYKGITEKDLVYFHYCLKKELDNGFIVRFNWGDDSVRKEVIMLPCTDFRGCFDTKGTWMHLALDKDNKAFIGYCNIMSRSDREYTKKIMKHIKIKYALTENNIANIELYTYLCV